MDGIDGERVGVGTMTVEKSESSNHAVSNMKNKYKNIIS